MSKVYLSIPLILLAIVLLSSCKKKNDSYVCKCNYSSSTTDYSETYEVGEQSSSSDAQAHCDKQVTELLGSGAVSATCTAEVK